MWNWIKRLFFKQKSQKQEYVGITQDIEEWIRLQNQKP